MASYLKFQDIAPGLSFHAALVLTHPRRPAGSLHTHDFPEMLYVMQGTGIHWVNGETLPLEAGDLIWIRPHDCHTVCGPSGRLHFVNIAFPISAWQEFTTAAGLDAVAAHWESAPLLPSVSLPPESRGVCIQAFQQALRDFHDSPTRFALCRFLAGALPGLLPSENRAETVLGGEALPSWLAGACAAMAQAGNLRAGTGRMAELAGVSPAHLSRSLKAHRNQTPTEFLLELRLQRASALLRTEAEEIGEIALDCGFENLSYFYRCFRLRFGQTPRVYRHDPRHKVLPLR